MSVQTSHERLDMIDEDLGYLLHEIQLSFWIDLTEQDIVEATTVGDLFDTVGRKMGNFESHRCLTSFAFYRLRRSLVEISGLDRRSIRPATRLRNLLDPEGRRKWWSAIETDLRFRVPDLRPGRAAATANWAIAILGTLAFMTALTPLVSWEAKFAIPFAVPLFMWGLFRAASCLPRQFPVDTFEDLVRFVVTLNQQKLAQEAGGSTVNQAWAAFRELLSGASGIRAASITREMRFPEDLKLS